MITQTQEAFSRYLSSKSENIRMPVYSMTMIPEIHQYNHHRPVRVKAFIPLLLYRFCFKFTWRADGRRECSPIFLFKMHYSRGARWRNDYTKSLRWTSFFLWWNWDFRSDVFTKTRNHAKPPKTTNKTSQNSPTKPTKTTQNQLQYTLIRPVCAIFA